MAKWIQRTYVSAPRNGTDSHTISFTAATAGSLLVLVMEGAVTHTVPTGWTRRAQALANSELSVYTKTATAGESSFSTTHNGTDYPVGAMIYEFATGSTWVNAVSSTPGGNTSAGPALTGLTGTNLLFGAVGLIHSTSTIGSNPQSVAWSGATGIVEDLDTVVLGLTPGTDGFIMGLAYVEDSVLTSFTPTPNVTSTTSNYGRECLTFAVKAAASTAVNMAGVVATSAAAAPAGTVLAARTVALTGVTATATATAPAGAVLTGGAAGVSGLVATATASAPAGTVTAASSGGGSTWTPGDPWTPSDPWGSGGTPVALSGAVASTAATAPAGAVFIPGAVSLDGPTATASCFAPAGTVRAGGLTYLLTTPTRDVYFRMAGRGLIASQPYALSMWRIAGQWSTGMAPSAEQLSGADRYYQGGYLHVLASDERDELVAAGFGALISETEEVL